MPKTYFNIHHRNQSCNINSKKNNYRNKNAKNGKFSETSCENLWIFQSTDNNMQKSWVVLTLSSKSGIYCLEVIAIRSTFSKAKVTPQSGVIHLLKRGLWTTEISLAVLENYQRIGSAIQFVWQCRFLLHLATLSEWMISIEYVKR